MAGVRLPDGGLIDRSRPLRFRFDGRDYSGFAGDTLASALLASGVMVFGRSFKYHRPRGVIAAGVEEPNALVGIGRGGRVEPNTRATDVMLYDGLEAVSQNRWPSLAVDFGAVTGLAARFIPAGFYYKTFFGGPKRWLAYEQLIRRAAGLGAAPVAADGDHYAHRSAFCDLLVVGSGPAGLAAADAAARGGKRVILVEQDSCAGGGLLRDPARIDGADSADWIAGVHARVVAGGGHCLLRTTAYGFYDDNLVALAQRLTEPGAAIDGPAQCRWHVRAAHVVLAQGAIERPLAFAHNDRPGVMLSGAVRTYIQRFGVRAGARVIVAGVTDDMHRTATALQHAGAEIVAVLDGRAGDVPLAATGRGRVAGLRARIGGVERHLACDLIAMSGGFTPSVHLHMQAGGTLDWDATTGAFVPAATRQAQISAGAGAGILSLDAALASGWAAGGGTGAPPASDAPGTDCAGTATLPDGVDTAKTFVDFQNDVSIADLDLAWREGYRSVEHMKRYTTLGMATDQGKTSNIAGLARFSTNAGRAAPEIGLTTFRPPFTPVTLGLLAGPAAGGNFAPVRRLALHDVHDRHAPMWQPLGLWHRPRAYPRPGESIAAAAMREARTVRTNVGLTDVSTLAKFIVTGADAAALLEAVCATRVANLAPGRGRYTVMLREDGMIGDDGTVWNLGDGRWYLTSSTGGAARMEATLAYVHRVLAPGFDAGVIDVQEGWSALAIAGPAARALIERLTGAAAPRHMGAAHARIGDIPVLLLAASYSGERAFELHVTAARAAALWAVLEPEIHRAGGCLYGLDAMELLRIEKGHIVIGAEASGRTTPHDLGLSGMVRAGGYFGAAALGRPALADPARPQLVGLESATPIPEGAMLLAVPGSPPQGYVTSAGARVLGDGAVALALLDGGHARHGETLTASSPTRGQTATVRVTAPLFHDPGGARYHD